IYKTAYAGASWQQLPSTINADFRYVNKVFVSPLNRQRLYAATSPDWSVDQTTTRVKAGVWRSLDGGTTWDWLLDATYVNGCFDLAIRTDQPTDYLFAACGNVSQGTVYRSAVYRHTRAEAPVQGFVPWTEVLYEPGMGRTSLAIAPSNQAVIYALSESTVDGQFKKGL